jgi:hypothetical protein
MALVGDEVAGDPMTRRRWIRRSLRKLEHALAQTGHRLGRTAIRRILRAHDIRPKGNVKHLTPRPHPDRDRQFQHIQEQQRRFARAGWPVVSVDTKKKELIGLFKNAGRAWNRHPPEVYSHDFPGDAHVKAVPYGIYDPYANHGAIFVGLSGDTPDFAVTALVRWWQQIGRRRYPTARRLLILADGGGSNGYRPRRWKQQLQARVVDAFGLTVTVCHYPPGASKWNPIEHCLFSQISQTWAGLPLSSIELMIHAIRATTTVTGLRVTVTLIPGEFPRKRTVSRAEWEALRIQRHKTCPQWNYTLLPRRENGK